MLCDVNALVIQREMCVGKMEARKQTMKAHNSEENTGGGRGAVLHDTLIVETSKRKSYTETSPHPSDEPSQQDGSNHKVLQSLRLADGLWYHLMCSGQFSSGTGLRSLVPPHVLRSVQ